MAQAIKLTKSGAGIVMVQAGAARISQIVGVLAAAGATDALNVTLYSCPSYSTSAIPAGSTELGRFMTAAASDSRVLDLSPDGIGVADFIAAQFTDTDTIHAVYVYAK